MNDQEFGRESIDIIETETTFDLTDLDMLESILADVSFKATALANARKHAQSDEREICGVCFGRVWLNAEAKLELQIEECWPAPHAQSSLATVAFTYESWAAALDHLDQLRDEQPKHGWRIVGWYHSHPNFGIFLSGTDQNTHHTYFPQTWHIALVLDPKRNVEGVFYRVGDKQALKQMPFKVIPTPTMRD